MIKQYDFLPSFLMDGGKAEYMSANVLHKTDLHIHSCYSNDGDYTPAELVQMCIDAGISRMAIADHNCIKGTQEAIEIVKSTQFHYYPAIEILGYDIELKRSDFEAIEQNVRKQCDYASKESLRLVNKMGFDLTEEDLKEVTSGGYWSECWTGEAFAEALLKNEKYAGNDLLLPYRDGGHRSDNPYVNFYWDYCAQGKRCYVPMTYPDMRDVIDIIHRNNGKAVLAHPGVNLHGNFDKIDQLIPLGLDGIEAYSSYHSPEVGQWFLRKAQHLGVFVTCGSDFHGKTKPAIKLGYCGVPLL